MLEVVEPGPLLLVQDGGRPGLAQLGVPSSGAADPWALAVANLLAGAAPGAPAIEVTLGGTELQVLETCAIAIGGADLGAERDDGLALAPGAVHVLRAGARVRFAGGRTGMRAYLGLAGGVVAPVVMGSASTWAPGAASGVLGRSLGPGDRLEPGRRGDLDAGGRVWPSALAPDPARERAPIPVIVGPDLQHLPADAVDRLVATSWRAAEATDRMGIRLDGPPMTAGREVLSHPLVPGAIQVPADGRPLVLLVDGPTIGGYPVVGVVGRAGLARLGQVRAGDPLRFAAQDAEAARAAWRERGRQLATAAAAIGADDVWARLQGHAGG